MKKLLLVIVGLNLITLDIFAGYLVYRNFTQSKNSTTSTVVQIADGVTTGSISIDDISCPTSCVNLIDESVSTVQDSGDITAPTPTTKPAAVPVTTAFSSPKTKQTSYVPIPGSGNTLSNDWTNIAGTDFYLSTADYPGLVGVYFEANIKLLNGNGEAFIRLYDATNNRGVDNSQVSTSSQTSVFMSNGPLSLWSGYNHYRVQVKSLTADSAIFESGRLKIITEN